MNQKEILDEAKKIISGERKDQYGNAEDSFKIIADLWNVYDQYKGKSEDDAKDVSLKMILLKIARTLGGEDKLDNYVDIAGYAALAGGIFTKQYAENVKLDKYDFNTTQDNECLEYTSYLTSPIGSIPLNSDGIRKLIDEVVRLRNVLYQKQECELKKFDECAELSVQIDDIKNRLKEIDIEITRIKDKLTHEKIENKYDVDEITRLEKDLPYYYVSF